MMESYVRVEHQEVIFYYGPFGTKDEAQKAAEKFKKTHKTSRDMKVNLSSWRSDEPTPGLVFAPFAFNYPSSVKLSFHSILFG
jgi:hypothetical protein